jgi:GTP cyclohydrolase I
LAPTQTALVAERFRTVMEALGLDLDDPNLNGTPFRVARAYRELFSDDPLRQVQGR